jgi:septal ring factor EnvC (AmiA/AmiB activator)
LNLRIPIILLILLSFFVLNHPPSYPEPFSQKKEELEKLKRELNQKKNLEREKKKAEYSILGEFETLDKKLTGERKELRSFEKNIKNVDQEINQLNQQIEETRRKIEDKKRILDARLRRIFKEDKMGDFLILAGGRNYQDLITRVHAMVDLSRRDVAALKEYRDGMALLRQKEDLLEGKRKELVGYKKGASERMEVIQNEKMGKKMLLAKVRTEKDLTSQAIRELEESTLKVQELMRQLELHPSKHSGFMTEKGKLPWPNGGEIVGTYGRNKHPKFDFFVFKKGMEIRPVEDDYIRSIYDGTVAYADWFKGYGLLVIIDHGESYYSLYAHASKVMVGVGDKVKQNQIVGEIGETGYSADQNLYFEIRHGGKAVDPVAWLSKKK